MRVKSEAKRNGIVDAAMEVFLDKGYEAASMSDIARHAGGSKATLYSYFSSKEELYLEVMNERCTGRFEQAYGNLQFDGDLRASLFRFGVTLFALLLSPDLLAMRRNLLCDASRSNIGRLFYEHGPAQGIARLATFLHEQMVVGRLQEADPGRAAQQLLALMECDMTGRAMLGVTQGLDQAELEATIGEAVRVFFCAYGPQPA
jgi:AcrR family transcriptional regulator